MSVRSITSARADVYARITSEIIASINAGAGCWRMPWHHHGNAITRPINVASGKRYRGINILALWTAANSAHYSEGVWGTYRQWLSAGAHVRKAERATTVVFWKEFTSKSGDSGDDSENRRRLFARAFSVFNAAQVDGYEPAAKAQPLMESERIASADRFFNALEIPISFGSYDAHYRISEDRIYMPAFSSFRDPASYAGVLMHEAGHASGARHRLDRNFHKRFGPQALAMEEAVAELTASYILADLGIAHRPRPDHAAYISSWLSLLSNDPHAIFTAASKAQAAADWMHTCQSAARAAA